MKIHLTDEQKIKVLNSDDLYKVMQQILLRENKIDQDKEHLWVVGLDIKCRILFIELVSLGSQNKTIAEPMEVYSIALQKRAASIIMVHNHPSGELEPSPEDFNITDQMYQTGLIVKTPLQDHLVISEKEYFSFVDDGLFDEVKKSLRFVPPYKIKERMERHMERTIKDREKSIAREMKQKQIEITMISECTGLSIEEIEEL